MHKNIHTKLFFSCLMGSMLFSSCEKAQTMKEKDTAATPVVEESIKNSDETNRDSKESMKESETQDQPTDQENESASDLSKYPEISEYRGTDPYQGTIKDEDIVNSKSLYETMTKEEAVEDLSYFYELLKQRHPAWIDGSTDKTDAVEEVYQQTVNSFTDQVSVLQLLQGSCKMAAVLRDAHTHVSVAEDNIMVLNDPTQLGSYGLPSKVNDIDIAEIEQKSKELTSYETEAGREYSLLHSHLCMNSYLELFGIDTRNGVDMKFKGDKVYHYNIAPYSEVMDKYQSGAKSNEDFVSYKIDDIHNLAVFTLRECNCDNIYISKVREFFSKVKEKGITHIAVDLRGNGGGNSAVADEFIKYLNHDSYQGLKGAMRVGDHLEYYGDELTKVNVRKDAYEGDIYVLTDTQTFSAAMDFGMLIQDNGFGKIVGVESSNLPHCYIDCLTFQMPHSKLMFTISYKAGMRVDSSKEYEPLTPDYKVRPEKALDKVYELIKEQ